jgi:predicted DNA binding CopG/RHH family protein
MKKHKIDNDMPIGKLTIVKDTLPSPEELMSSERTVKVTLRLSQKSMDFFKEYARTHHTKYQKMIRRLVDAYAEKHALSH